MKRSLSTTARRSRVNYSKVTGAQQKAAGIRKATSKVKTNVVISTSRRK